MDMHFHGVVFQSHAAELARRIERPWPHFAVLDVRTDEEHRRQRIPGSRPFDPERHGDSLPAGIAETTELFVVGEDPEDERVRAATRALRALGARRIVEVPGGLFEWKQLGLPVDRGDAGRAA